MAIDWQTGATMVCVAFAALVVLQRVARAFVNPEDAGCRSGCSNCPSPNAGLPAETDFVSLQSLVNSSHTVNSLKPHSPRQ